MRKLAVAAALAVLLPLAAAAQEYATTKDAELLVRRAAAFLKAEGKEKALPIFSDPKGQFAYRDLYVTVYDMEGRCLAHGQKKERVGKLFIDDKDVDGKPFIRERLEIVKAHGKGWQEYKFMNPLTKTIEQKVAYFEKAGDVVIMAGAYKRK
jgi:signal transduction histidine kinase